MYLVHLHYYNMNCGLGTFIHHYRLRFDWLDHCVRHIEWNDDMCQRRGLMVTFCWHGFNALF